MPPHAVAAVHERLTKLPGTVPLGRIDHAVPFHCAITIVCAPLPPLPLSPMQLVLEIHEMPETALLLGTDTIDQVVPFH
jgi:hypothetical protein